MSTHVYANNNEIASKASVGKSIAVFPDTCFSPPAPPVGPIPIPYPNTAQAVDMNNGTAKVFICEKMIAMEDTSCFCKSIGDDGATKNFQKGILNNSIQGKACFINWSQTVKFEGKGIPRNQDSMTHNHGSTENTQSNTYKSEEAKYIFNNITEEKINKKSVKILVGIFLDGTGCDKEVVTSKQLQTNIAKLYNYYSNDDNLIYKIYIRGIGTIEKAKFDENGNRIENFDSISLATGRGDEGYKTRLKIVKNQLNSILLKKFHLQQHMIYDIFGFSRGAALARHIASQLDELKDSFYTNFQTKNTTTIKFIGLFDTVASIFPGGNAGEGSLTLKLPGALAGKVYQLTAAHEFRESFPLRSVIGVGEEEALPGAHSDIGGGQICHEECVLLAKINQHDRIIANANELTKYLYSIVVKYSKKPPYKFTFNIGEDNDILISMKTVADNSAPWYTRRFCFDFYIYKIKRYVPFIEYAALYRMFFKAKKFDVPFEATDNTIKTWIKAHTTVMAGITKELWENHVSLSSENNYVSYMHLYELIKKNNKPHIQLKETTNVPKVKNIKKFNLPSTIAYALAKDGIRDIYNNDGSLKNK